MNEFYRKMKEKAKEYAYEMVMDPEEHQDAIECIIGDYMRGAQDAREYLTNK